METIVFSNRRLAMRGERLRLEGVGIRAKNREYKNFG
jgi:hypothetical protein